MLISPCLKEYRLIACPSGLASVRGGQFLRVNFTGKGLAALNNLAGAFIRRHPSRPPCLTRRRFDALVAGEAKVINYPGWVMEAVKNPFLLLFLK